MTKTDKFWNVVDQKVRDVRMTQEAIALGDQARAALANPVIEEWFIEKFRAIVNVMLDPATPDSDLPRWKARAGAVLDHYTEIVAKVSAGDLASKRLVELAANEKKTKEE